MVKRYKVATATKMYRAGTPTTTAKRDMRSRLSRDKRNRFSSLVSVTPGKLRTNDSGQKYKVFTAKYKQKPRPKK